MSKASAAPKRNRRVVSSRGDSAILKSVADFQFVTVEMVAKDANRNAMAVRRRMLSLYQAGILNRVRRHRLFIYFLSPKGSYEARRHGHLPRFVP
jgi:hypothetical protein